MPDDEILTISEAADFLKCSVSFLQKAARAGKVPATRLGTDYRFRRSHLLAWLDSRETGPTVTGLDRDADQMLAVLERRGDAADDDEDLGE